MSVSEEIFEEYFNQLKTDEEMSEEFLTQLKDLLEKNPKDTSISKLIKEFY